ncbi:TonB-dependent receptor [Horticoccus sp. 23ND18S-11]|uniref:TonB-dependent receptor n=1 Tax=Horticoccus sp. 23ND18S-11 TaxID=3391832 RepID=UPI0039C96EB6
MHTILNLAGRLRLLLSFVLLTGVALAQTAGSNVISGQVSNAVTKSYLQGAVVEIAGTALSATTDREGRYEFFGVPAGPATLVVNFTGLDALRVPIVVTPGQRMVKDVELTSSIYKMEKFTVAGEREGTAKAETLQRLAPNVKNIVSSDTFGNIADGNIGDMLQHVVGITADYNGPDVRQISIRGVGSALSSVTMDGAQVASAQSAGTGRQFEFETASLGNIESIEVTKAPTPDMDGASIGGSVNLVTKSPFDSKQGRIFTYTVGLTAQPTYSGPVEARWKQPIRGFGPSVNLNYSDVLGEKRNFGMTLTATVHSQPAGGALINSTYERRNDPGPAFANSISRYIVNGATRSRIATGAKFVYKWSENTTVSLNNVYNYFHENNDTRFHVLNSAVVTGAGLPNLIAEVDAAGRRTGGGFVKPGYTNTVTQIFANSVEPVTPGAGTRDTAYFTSRWTNLGGTANLNVASNDKSGRTFVFSPSVRHRFPGLQIDYSVSYSDSATYYDVIHERDKYSARPTGSVFLEIPNLGFVIDRSQDKFIPTVRQTEGPSWQDFKNYSRLRIDQTDQRGYDKVYSAKFDLKKDLSITLPTYVKTGFTAQRQTRKLWQDPRRYFYTGPDGILNTADDNNGIEIFNAFPKSLTWDEKEYYQNRGGVPPWVDAYKVAAHRRDNPRLWKEDVELSSRARLTTDQQVEETIGAAYVMAGTRITRQLSLLTGVRLENTEVEGEGPLNYTSPQEAARRAAWVGPITDVEQIRRNVAQYSGRSTNKGDYRFFLPGVHLKYQPTAGLVSRLSWSTGVGRPPFGNIIPNTTVNDAGQTITVTNPNLKPQYARNWDFTTEYYFNPQGMISFGAFHKKINDYIQSDSSQFVAQGQNNGYDGQYAGYRINTSINSGYAQIRGLEFNYQQQLTFLPGWARGFGVYMNATKLWTKGNNSAFVTGPGSSAGGTLAGFLDFTGNIGVSFRGYGFDLRLQAVHRGEYLISNSTTPALVTWQLPKTSWTWKSRYAFTKTLSAFVDLENFTEELLDNRYAAYKDRPNSWRTFHTKVVFGVTGRL